jgi:GntR family transcriptional regulator, transcriptional repressor for pyruvate dehydrogenase complex
MLSPLLGLRVNDYIFDYIRRNQLSSGEDLPSEIRTCADLNVSRSVVREAFRSLEFAGILAKENGRSPKVGVLNSDFLTKLIGHALLTNQVSLRQVLELRAAIEVKAAGLAAQRGTRNDVEELQIAAAGMRQSADLFDDFVQHDFHFHEVINNATGNPLIGLICDAMHESMKASMYAGLSRRRSKQEIICIAESHVEIADAIARGKAREAELHMQRHFEETFRAIGKVEMNLEVQIH